LENYLEAELVIIRWFNCITIDILGNFSNW